eukprot:13450343-Alexandrium_andersonii.AAC.1
MSASLVGSEMCIRDRAASALLLHAVPRSAHLEGVAWAPVVRLGPMLSVSYTHLTLPTICSV